jgi:hypothetical protein
MNTGTARSALDFGKSIAVAVSVRACSALTYGRMLVASPDAPWAR